MPHEGEGQPLLVLLPGGGFAAPDLDAHEALVRALVLASGVRMLVCAYPPRFPDAVEAAHAALSWVAGHLPHLGVDGERVGVGGFSAGGALATGAALLAAERGGPPLRALVLLHPDADLRSAADPEKAEQVRAYLGGADPADPLASPLLARGLGRLPPAIVLTGERDHLRGQGEALAARLRLARVPVAHRRWPAPGHAALLDPAPATARDAVAWVADAVRHALAPAPDRG